MSDPERIPKWLKSLPLAPEYHPTETEFADPIALISRIEREASAFGICKIVPPLPKPSKKFVLSNLTRSLAPNPSRAPSSSSPTRFTTRHQELGARREPAHRHRQQVWQSGEFYTLDQFESKSKSFQKSQLSGFKEVTPLLIESLFWKAASEKPIYIEYANDVPGSGFAAPEEPFMYRKKRRKLAEQERSSVEKGTVGWKLSNSPWNLQAIARAPGSLTRFMPDEVPGVTSPMVYIGMLFSWFAWHVEDHELHSLNFLHMGAPKTWYAVAGEHASRLEEIVRVEGYGGDLDRLEAFTMLGEKTTLLSPEVIVKSGVPCCRLVQNPGDFVVTFPRAYHIGFSHGFNCGEAANFATPQWLKVAKEAAVRRAAMNHLPMLSHQQLLYMLTVSFVSRVPRALLSGVRSSRLSDRKREEREILVKKAFLSDMINENNLLCALIQKGSTSYAVLWEPDLLPNLCTGAQSFYSSRGVQGSAVTDVEGKDITPPKHKGSHSSNDNENPSYELNANPTTSKSCYNPVEKDKNASHVDDISSMELLEILDAEEDDLPFGLNIDSGTLACVACGILGYPFMAIVQPSEATKELLLASGEDSHMRLGNSGCSQISSCFPNTASQLGPEGTFNILQEQENLNSSCKVSSAQFDHVSFLEGIGTCDGPKLLNDNRLRESMNTKTNPAREIVSSKAIVPGIKPLSETHSTHDVPVKTSSNEKTKWTSSHGFNRPRIFCLQHALEVDRLLHSKGGAHVLVICHSDYLKIKAYIPSIAEEVGMGINITDVPLENASPSDLNLINISIDDGEHEEHGEDWTSNLGVNLQYSMKLRKQSTSKQERLTLALGRIFSDTVSLSDFSTLQWHSKRSRTPYKVVGMSVAKSHIDANMENSNVLERYLNANFSPKVKDFQSCRRNPNDMASKHHGFKNVQKEFGSSSGSSVVNVKDDYSTASYSHNLSERVEVDHTKGLFTVPVSSIEDLQMQEGSWFPLKVSRADEVTNSENRESHHPCVLIPVLESSDTCQGTNSPVQFLTKCRVDNSKNQESQPYLLELETTISEVPNEIEALDEINSEREVYNNVESDIDPASQGAVTGDLQDFPMPQERKSRVSGLVNYLLSAEQSHVPTLSNDKAKLEVANSDESNLELNISHSLKSVGQIVSNHSKVDSLGVHQKEIPMVQVSVEEVPKMEDSVNHSSKSVEQVVSTPLTINRCRIQEKEIPQLGVPIGEEPKIEGRIDPSLRSKKHFFEHPSSVDSCGVQQELSTAEESGENGNDDHSSRSERLLVSNLPMLDTTTGMQQETPDTENNLQSVSNVQLVTQQNPPMVVNSEVQQEISVDGTNTDSKVSSLKPVVESSSANSEHITAASEAGSAVVQESDKNKELFVESSNKNQNSVCIIQYVRRRSKRKREEQMEEDHHKHKRTGSFICSGREEHIAEDHQIYNGSFIRGPCEGLRPRTRQVMGAPEKVGSRTGKQSRAVSNVKRRSSKDKIEESCERDIQNCCSKLRRKGDVHLHMQNRCMYRGCRKQFRSHNDLMRHLRVHDDERPLKCPWKGCHMSFKWEWARTEHLRLHTGERPYRCAIAGCELTFRYVSDFSRHRRKTGHYVNLTDG